MATQKMHYIADAVEAKEIDRISIQEIGIPSMVLMERAAMCVASCIMDTTNPETDKILAVCGTGNNGGDGVAVIRMLWEAGYSASVLVLGQIEKCSEEMSQQIAIAGKLGIPVVFSEGIERNTCLPADQRNTDCIGEDRDSLMSAGGANFDLVDSVTEEKLEKYTVIIDAIFGIGLSREVTGSFREWIAWMNRTAARVVSVDIPSGIHAGTGEVLGIAVQAEQTVTFGVNKRGLVLYPGTQYAGEIVVADMGFPRQAVKQVSPKAYTYQPLQIASLLPKRKTRSHKGSYGKVLVIAGSPQMSGACYFASAAAYRVGAGLVQVLTAQENAAIIRTKLPEAIVNTWSEEGIDTEIEAIRGMMEQASSIVIGPGLGMSDAARKLVKLVLDYEKTGEKAVVIDADGLNLLAEMEEYFVSCGSGGRKLNLHHNIILTPHLKEMSRLIRQEVPVIASHMADAVLERGSGCTIVLKDARTLVSDGADLYINTTGNHALAKGGSGDVLSGMIGGFLAQGMKPLEAASLAVCLHGMTADDYVRDRGSRSMLASDILEEIPRVMQ